MSVDEFKALLTEMLRRADHTVSTEVLCGRMWQQFLPSALHLYTTAGVLEQIAAHIAEPSGDDEEEEEEAA